MLVAHASRCQGGGNPLPGYPDVVLFEAISREGSAGCRGLPQRGRDAPDLVIPLFVAPGPVEPVPVLRLRLPRILVAVELVALFGRDWVETLQVVTGGGAVSRRAHALAPRPVVTEHQVVCSTPLVSPTA